MTYRPDLVPTQIRPRESAWTIRTKSLEFTFVDWRVTGSMRTTVFPVPAQMAPSLDSAIPETLCLDGNPGKGQGLNLFPPGSRKASPFSVPTQRRPRRSRRIPQTVSLCNPSALVQVSQRL